MVTSRQRAEYSIFERWHRKAAIGPLRCYEVFPSDMAYSPDPKLFPAAGHDLVQRAGPSAQRLLCALKAADYLAFTDLLENKVVVPTADSMARRPAIFGLSDALARDMRLIQIEEEWHAFYSTEVRLSICRAFGLDVTHPTRANWLDDLQAIQQEAPEHLREHILAGFTIISETLVTGTLSDLPRDLRVAENVRRIIEDHRDSEGDHHRQFAKALRDGWSAWTDEERAVVGPLLPRFIRLFLDPDITLIRSWLYRIGLDPKDAERVLRECYPPERVRQDARAAAKFTLKYLKQAGVFDDPRCRAALERHSLAG